MSIGKQMIEQLRRLAQGELTALEDGDRRVLAVPSAPVAARLEFFDHDRYSVTMRSLEVGSEAPADGDVRAYLSATAAEIARLATYLGLDVPRDRVRKQVLYWHRHKRIEQRSADAEGSPMFRYGEVRGMLYREFGTRVS